VAGLVQESELGQALHLLRVGLVIGQNILAFSQFRLKFFEVSLSFVQLLRRPLFLLNLVKTLVRKQVLQSLFGKLVEDLILVKRLVGGRTSFNPGYSILPIDDLLYE